MALFFFALLRLRFLPRSASKCRHPICRTCMTHSRRFKGNLMHSVISHNSKKKGGENFVKSWLLVKNIVLVPIVSWFTHVSTHYDCRRCFYVSIIGVPFVPLFLLPLVVDVFVLFCANCLSETFGSSCFWLFFGSNRPLSVQPYSTHPPLIYYHHTIPYHPFLSSPLFSRCRSLLAPSLVWHDRWRTPPP